MEKNAKNFAFFVQNPKIFSNKNGIKPENLATKSYTPDFLQQKVDFAQTFRHGHQTTLKTYKKNAKILAFLAKIRTYLLIEMQ